MQRPQRIRKPNSRYDPNFYVLASFPKKNKHTIIPKHQVTIDVIDTQNGTVRSSGFVQPVRIIAEGSRSKCQERASQFSRDTGSEEVDVRPDNDDEDELVDNNHIYTTQNFYNNESSQYSSITTSVHSNVVDEMSDICEEDNDEEYIPILKKKSTQKKRKRTLRSKQSTSNSVATVEITNLQKEFLLHQFKVENRLKALEKTFRILKNRKILRENKNLSNIVNSAFSSRPSPPTEPEFVLGVDVSNFPFGFNEHTRFIRQIFRAAGYASNPNAVLCDEEKVTELKDVMKKRDKTLQDDEEALAEAWQVVKESVRQLKHDHKRNEIFKTIRTSTTNTNTSNTSPFKDTENNSINIAPN
ncbi:unnamed protein product [Rotaria sp. Silwood1]|nr:unnamed protein product [Rotaria sp. Silwood1]